MSVEGRGRNLGNGKGRYRTALQTESIGTTNFKEFVGGGEIWRMTEINEFNRKLDRIRTHLYH